MNMYQYMIAIVIGVVLLIGMALGGLVAMLLGGKMAANDKQVSGTHYKDKDIQPWDYIAANKLGYFEGNVVKYVSRWKSKGGLEDLKKARHYLDKLIELNR